MPRTKATPKAKAHEYHAERYLFHGRDIEERCVFAAIEEAQLKGQCDVDVDTVLERASAIADELDVDLASYLLVTAVVALSEQYTYLLEREAEILSFKSGRIAQLRAAQFGLPQSAS